jgi:putative endonuclease
MVGPNSAIAVYIMASGRNGTLYIGVTSDLNQRVATHKGGGLEGFSKKYGCKRLVWYEPQGDMRAAIQREKTLKRWVRKWKLALIEDLNPEWRDLAEGWGEVALAGSSGLPLAFSEAPPEEDDKFSHLSPPRTPHPSASAGHRRKSSALASDTPSGRTA